MFMQRPQMKIIGVANSSLYIDGKLMSSVSGGSLSYSWNVKKVTTGTHTIAVTAVDTSGNNTTTSVQVTK